MRTQVAARQDGALVVIARDGLSRLFLRLRSSESRFIMFLVLIRKPVRKHRAYGRRKEKWRSVQADRRAVREMENDGGLLTGQDLQERQQPPMPLLISPSFAHGAS